MEGGGGSLFGLMEGALCWVQRVVFGSSYFIPVFGFTPALPLPGFQKREG